ncbi:unnamed protein product [Amoebophrya sp. A25]|nr:unnamed protein product [Amoebophrya sp. A25]|eukprot:GSA25T00017836001.1
MESAREADRQLATFVTKAPAHIIFTMASHANPKAPAESSKGRRTSQDLLDDPLLVRALERRGLEPSPLLFLSDVIDVANRDTMLHALARSCDWHAFSIVAARGGNMDAENYRGETPREMQRHAALATGEQVSGSCGRLLAQKKMDGRVVSYSLLNDPKD